MAFLPPDDVVAAAGPVEAWQAAEASNDRGEHVWFARDLVVSRQPLGVGRAQAERMAWLVRRAPTAAVELVVSDDEFDWVITQRLSGHPSHRIDAHGDMQGVPATFARALRALHELPVEVDDVPFGVGWQAIDDQIEAGVSALDPAELPDPYSRYSAERLVEIWRHGRPASEDLVLCHGDPSLPNLIIDPAVVGWVDVGRLCLADRHLDLAIAQYSIHRNFGPDAVFAFFEAYEIDPDLVRLDHYLLASFLLP